MEEINAEDLDLSGTVFSNADVEIIDSNGTLYLAGWDDYGWFTITHIDVHPTDSGQYSVEMVGECPHTSFNPDNIGELRNAMER